jgi:hypothetical protein
MTLQDRLRDWRITGSAGPLRREAADEIDRLQARVEALDMTGTVYTGRFTDQGLARNRGGAGLGATPALR